MRKVIITAVLATIAVPSQAIFAKADKEDYKDRHSSYYQNYASLDRLPKRIAPRGYRMFVFSPRYKTWVAYNKQGYMVAYGKANGGSHYCSDLGRACRTPGGTFRVHNKGTAGCKSSKFPLGRGGAPMPYCMYFRGGYAIHGSPYISNRNGSHGCIRVKTNAAHWLHKYFLQVGTRVHVLSY